MVIGAFSKPLTKTSQPVQFTFVVGGGKLVRARYPDELRRWMSDALKELGFDEDRGGSLGSQGCFKHQHDTGLNLVKVCFNHTDLNLPLHRQSLQSHFNT